ncbi:MAG: tail fiber protein [Leptospiraceae bacterium]|nr:tail fiber protein [Leptospiraceae bacterium]
MKSLSFHFKKESFKEWGIVVVILFFLGTAWAVTGLVGTYNSFSDGETLTASKLNANFNALKTAIASTVGTISAYGGNTAPTGWLLYDGTAVSQTTYADLFAVIGCNFGCSGGNFNLPDLRGRFLRGRDGGSGRDPDSGARTAMGVGGNTADNVGSVQVDELKSHTHTVQWSYDGSDNDRDDSHPGVGLAYPNGGLTTTATGGSETRPVNAYVNWIVKY